MLFAYSTSIYRFRPLSEAIEGIARNGFCAVELIADRPHALPEDLKAAEITALRQCLDQRKMKITNLNSCVVTALGDARNPSWLDEDWMQRETRIRYTLDCVRMAAAMGIPYVSTKAGGVIPSTMNFKDAWRLFVADLHRVIPIVKKLGVKLLLQPEPGSLVETSEQTVDLLKEFEFDPFLGINFDPGHFFCVGEDPCEAWDKQKSHVLHVHLEDIPDGLAHRHIQLGDGIMDIPAFLGCVKESDYQGYVTMKLDFYDQQAEEVIAASAAYLREKGFMPSSAETCS